MNKHYENIHRYDFITKELLEEEYVQNGLSDKQIAEKYSVGSKTVVWRKRQKFGIKNKYAAKSNRHAITNRKFSITKNRAQQMLDSNMTFEQISSEMGCSIIVAKRRFKELGLCREQDHAEKYKFWEVELTQVQKQFLVGSTLGDGTITSHGAYSCSHSVKQSHYHKHKRDVLSSIHAGKFQHCIHKAVGVDGKPHESLMFTTGTNKFCAQLRKIYYPDGKKVFPNDFIREHISPQAVAYWYMDDGTAGWNNQYKSNSKGAMILTYGYTYKEQELMKSMFRECFGLVSAIVYDNTKDAYVQQFRTIETPKLFELIKPYIVPSMMYKIDYNVYREQRSSLDERGD